MTVCVSVSAKQAVFKAAAVLRRGGLVVFPTDTSYGLGADATNRKAVRKVYAVKKMPCSKKVSVMVSGKAMAHCFFGRSRRVDALMDAFLPGPLTIVTKGRSFRIPDHAFCQRLAKALGRPVTATSANITGTPDLYSVVPMRKQLHGVDLIIDGGRLPKRRPSTVYDVDAGVVVRKGPIAEGKIKSVLNKQMRQRFCSV